MNCECLMMAGIICLIGVYEFVCFFFHIHLSIRWNRQKWRWRCVNFDFMLMMNAKRQPATEPNSYNVAYSTVYLCCSWSGEALGWLLLNERHNLIIETSISPDEWDFFFRYPTSVNGVCWFNVKISFNKWFW